MTDGVVTIISSELLHSTGLVINGVSTRKGGVSPEPFGMNLSFRVGDAPGNVETNRMLFARALGIGADRFAIPAQVHGTVVRVARRAGRYPACDGLVTDTPGVFLCTTLADCIPVFILETRRKAVAALHAGWRGTSAGIVGRGVEALVGEFRCQPGHMVAFVGPGAAKCCYTVGQDVTERFPRDFVHVEGGLRFVDLKAALVSQLTAAGVPPSRIEVSPRCTIHETVFHSFRRDGASSGRMMGVVGLTHR